MIGRFETFTFALSKLSSYWNKIAAEELASYGLKSSYLVYLVALFKNEGGFTSAELCKMCVKDKAEVSRGIHALEEKGLVSKDAANSYRAKITLTEEGRTLTGILRERIKVAVEKGGAGLSEEQRESFYAALKIISENLEEISKVGL